MQRPPLYFNAIPEDERDRRCILDSDTCVIDEEFFYIRRCIEIPRTGVHLRDNGVRPWVELKPTKHPLAVEQRDGVTVDRVVEIYAHYVHGYGKRELQPQRKS